jgi:2-polyprenyl-6-methoxyphenol hydroxylase-like FAD-dependent oxidoreductase
VLIPGAGPTGLTLACGLLANGVAARIVDEAAGPAGTSRALGLQPRGIEVVERLDALNSLPERALQVAQSRIHTVSRSASPTVASAGSAGSWGATGRTAGCVSSGLGCIQDNLTSLVTGPMIEVKDAGRGGTQL